MLEIAKKYFQDTGSAMDTIGSNELGDGEPRFKHDEAFRVSKEYFLKLSPKRRKALMKWNK